MLLFAAQFCIASQRFAYAYEDFEKIRGSLVQSFSGQTLFYKIHKMD